MDETVKQKWINALRSGDYEQGIGALRKTNGTDTYCCLGVLCDLYQDATEQGEWKKPGHREQYLFITPGGEEQGVLPNDVRDWAGLDVNQGALLRPEVLPDDKSRCSNLSSLNDADYSFGEIADIIEQNL